MSWLLKLVEGPMAGAEVALVNGTRVKVGTSDDCDIVIVDASLPDFTLDVAEGAVTLLTASGETRVLKPFEIESQGQTAFAIGPAEGVWQSLVRPAPTPVSTPAPESDEPVAAPEHEKPADAERSRRTPLFPRRRGIRAGGGVDALVGVWCFFFFCCWRFWPGITGHRFENGILLSRSVSRPQSSRCEAGSHR